MADLGPQSHCHRCGTPYAHAAGAAKWPRRCGECGNLQFFNPTPIGVMLQQVRDGDRIGIATPIRGLAPMRGHPAITGGYHDGSDQSSQDAGSREIWEEIRLPRLVDPDEAELLMTQSTGPFIPGRRQNLVFSVSPIVVPISAFDGFAPDAETLAMHYSWAPEVLAFPSHTRALALYFKRYQGVHAPRAYTVQPRTGDAVDGLDAPVFEVPYHQPALDDGVWHVLIEDGGAPMGVVERDGGWKVAA